MAEIQELAVVLATDIDNPDLGDLRLTSAGDFEWLTALDASVAQRLFVRLSFFKGEWLLDTDLGTPYYQAVLGFKAPSRNVVQAVFTDVLTNTEGVADLLNMNFSISRERELSLMFEVRLEDGTLFKSRDYARFVVVA